MPNLEETAGRKKFEETDYHPRQFRKRKNIGGKSASEKIRTQHHADFPGRSAQRNASGSRLPGKRKHCPYV